MDGVLLVQWRKHQKGSSRGQVTVEKDAFVGAGSIILPNVTVGEGSIIAAGATVTKSRKPWSITGSGKVVL